MWLAAAVAANEPRVLMTSFERRRDGLEPALWLEIWGDRLPIFDDFHQLILRDGNVSFRRQSGIPGALTYQPKADIDNRILHVLAAGLNLAKAQDAPRPRRPTQSDGVSVRPSVNRLI